MSDPSIPALICLLETLRPIFSTPSFNNFVNLALGWLLIPGRHAVTGALVVTGISQSRHHSAFHRFFSLARWNPDDLGHRLFLAILGLLNDGAPIPVVVDDTLNTKKGRNIYGLGSHVDPVRSTRRHTILCFGHVWVVLAVAVHFPFCQRPWALPILLRLYRSKKRCLAKGWSYRKKTELAREMLDVLAGWVGDRRVEVVADAAYCNATVTKGLAINLVLFGAMRPDAALTAPPSSRGNRRGGRPRIRGRRLPSPEKVFRTARYGWYANAIWLYRKKRMVTYQTWTAQWYRACGGGLLRIVLVMTESGEVPFRVFFCTDPSVEVEYLLQRFSSRWSIEVTFYDLKQYLGFGDSQAWTKKAVERTTPFVAYLFTVIVIWFATSAAGSRLDVWPIRPWYRHKRTPSFQDMLGAAQRAALLSGVFDPTCNSNNLQNPLSVMLHRRGPPRRLAA